MNPSRPSILKSWSSRNNWRKELMHTRLSTIRYTWQRRLQLQSTCRWCKRRLQVKEKRLLSCCSSTIFAQRILLCASTSTLQTKLWWLRSTQSLLCSHAGCKWRPATYGTQSSGLVKIRTPSTWLMKQKAWCKPTLQIWTRTMASPDFSDCERNESFATPLHWPTTTKNASSRDSTCQRGRYKNLRAPCSFEMVPSTLRVSRFRWERRRSKQFGKCVKLWYQWRRPTLLSSLWATTISKRANRSGRCLQETMRCHNWLAPWTKPSHILLLLAVTPKGCLFSTNHSLVASISGSPSQPTFWFFLWRMCSKLVTSARW